MQLCKDTKKLLFSALSKRLKEVQKYDVAPVDLAQFQKPQEDEEEVLRKLMVVLRKDLYQLSNEVLECLKLLVFLAQKEDLRFFDAFHFYFESLQLEKSPHENVAVFLSIYLALLEHHLNAFQLDEAYAKNV